MLGLSVSAQKVSFSFKKTPLPAVLKRLNSASDRYKIFFIYDELEDFTVTTDIRNRSIPDAVREAIGYYPMRVSFGDSIISVECAHKEQGRLIGRIVDNHGLPVEFANIALLNLADSSYITGGVSNANGDFVIPCSAPRVLAKVSFVGCKTFYKRCNVGNIGTLKLSPEAIILKGVTIKSNLPKTQIRNDAMVTMVSGTILEKSGTVEDLLNHIPLVDASNGSVEVFGRGTAEIYINGRKLRDNNELQQMTSEDIRQVEVVNNPGARYDASTKAVIRIRTKRRQGEGFGFRETAELRNYYGWGMKEQIDMNYRRGGLDISGRLSGKKTTGGGDLFNIIDTYLDKRWHQENTSNPSSYSLQGVAMLQANYVLNDNNSMGIRYEYSRIPKQKQWGMFNSTLWKDGNLEENNESDLLSVDRISRHGVNAYYNGKLGNWSIDFNADGLWIKTDGMSYAKETTMTNNGKEENRTVKPYKSNDNTLLAAKLMAERPLSGGTICLGGEISTNIRNNGYTDESGLTISDKSKVEESIFAGFMEYSRKFGRINAIAGLRYEHVNSDYYLYGVRQDEQSRRYADLFPSLNLSATFGKVSLSLGYSNDIARPAYNNLSSEVMYLNRYTYQGGNPTLRPSYTHNIVLTAAYSYWLLVIGHKHIKDDWANVFKTYGDNPSIAYFYPANINSYDYFYCALTASPTIWGIWNPKITAMLDAQDYSMDTPSGHTRLNHPSVTIKWNNIIKLPWNIRFEANITFSSNGDHKNYRTKNCNVWSSISLRRDFCKNRLSVQIKADDPFELMKSTVDIYSENRIFRSFFNDSQRNLIIKAVYKFNVSRDKYKGRGAGNAEKNRL